MSDCPNAKNCCICTKGIDQNEEIIIGKCNHESCSKCLVTYLTNNLKAKIKCPVTICDMNIRDPIIRKCLSIDQTRTYDNLSFSGKCKKCPIPDCPFIYVCEDKNTIFECGYCGAPICVDCNSNHYYGMCGKIQSQDVIMRANEKIKAKRRIEFQEMDSKYDLLPNPVAYECTFCTDYILPFKGVILRNCLDCFCEKCLKEAFNQIHHLYKFKCQVCHTKLQDRELRVLIEEKRFVGMIVKEACLLMYHCKSPNCTKFWHVATDAVSYICPECKQDNCLKCKDIHTGIKCEKFQTSKKYLDFQKEMAKVMEELRVECRNCRRVLFQNGGCGAIWCENCGNHTCIFTGLFAGRHDMKECGCWSSGRCDRQDKYCNCSAKVPCHEKCKYGCLPEAHD